MEKNRSTTLRPIIITISGVVIGAAAYLFVPIIPRQVFILLVALFMLLLSAAFLYFLVVAFIPGGRK